MRNQIFTKFVAGVELQYICHNYSPFNKNYDDRCVGWVRNKPIAIIQRTYY